MYTTKFFSSYKKSPEAISLPPEGPNSGYLVLEDDESNAVANTFGLHKDAYIKGLPFPQNRQLSIVYHDSNDDPYNEVYLIPVINQPLSLNRYYAIKADGKRKGQAYASSKDEDKGTSCFCFPYISDVTTRPFNSEDIYQQFEFSVTASSHSNMLVAKSVASDGHPPYFLRRVGWHMYGKPLKISTLGEARGIDSSLRDRLPDFSFALSQDCSKPVVVGKWYCPFIFIQDGKEKDQIKHSVFYEMILKQRWERISYAEKSHPQENAMTVNVTVPTKLVKIAGYQIAEQEEKIDDRSFMWFKSITTTDEDESVAKTGLSSVIVDRMIWEQERVGWVGAAEKHVKVSKHEEYEGDSEWKSYGCYMLSETFVLKRNDGSIVLTYEFKHTHQIRSKWE